MSVYYKFGYIASNLQMDFLEDNKEIFNVLFQGISEGVIVVNHNQIIVSTNSAGDEMFGYEKGELIGENLNVLIPQNFRKDHKKHLDNYSEKPKRRKMGESRDLFGLKKDGEQFPLEAGLNPFSIYGKNYVMALVVNVTQRKEHEKKIKHLNEVLEYRVAERTKQLNDSILSLKNEIKKRVEAEEKALEALEKEKELNELKTKFLSLVSHEFKTPLAGIITSATLIGKYKKGEEQPKRNKHLNTIKNKVKYLDNILNEFLSLERIESGKVKYTIKTIWFQEIFNHVVSQLEVTLKLGQQIVCNSDIFAIYIKFDEKVLELILFNLINNAIKYSPENSCIYVTVNTTNQEMNISIEDQGIGIPKEEQKFVFDRYFRAQNALVNQGTGIGLNIVKSHLENLGGSILFKSEEGVGSTFTVRLKAAIIRKAL